MYGKLQNQYSMNGHHRRMSGRITRVSGTPRRSRWLIRSCSHIRLSATQPSMISTGLGFLSIH
jgi:hypothetical protein